MRMITENKTPLFDLIAGTVAAVVKFSRGRLFQLLLRLITSADLWHYNTIHYHCKKKKKKLRQLIQDQLPSLPVQKSNSKPMNQREI